MAILYRDFSASRTAFYVAILLFSAIFSFSAHADDSLFVVRDVRVDVTSENSVAARDEAFVKAQVQAFEILKQRMVDERQAANMATPDPLAISAMIQDYEITDEKLSAVRYVGTYTFRFKPQAVSKFFSTTGVTYTDTSSKPLLILPFYQIGPKSLLWSDDNVWLTAWSSEELPQSLVPVEVPLGDLMDVADIGETNGLNYNPAGLTRILARYGAKEAALMLATPDGELASAQGDNDPVGGNLVVSVYRTDRAGPELVQDFIINAQANETRSELYSRAVKTAYGILQQDWKQKTSASAAQKNHVQVRIPVSGLQDWVRIRKNLDRMTGIEKIEVLSLTPSEVRLEFDFRGDEERLRQVLAQGGMRLGEAYQSPGMPPLYDLVPETGRGNDFLIRNEEPAAGEPAMEEEFGVRTF
ncbi:MAG: DUF2066 domain-containing protein [Alphaproteobacteria bacterium]|nr:DUF2066 domain-containing protein [Alphaproteobacteria bacterium]